MKNESELSEAVKSLAFPTKSMGTTEELGIDSITPGTETQIEFRRVIRELT